jgi:hypothetical protein
VRDLKRENNMHPDGACSMTYIERLNSDFPYDVSVLDKSVSFYHAWHKVFAL